MEAQVSPTKGNLLSLKKTLELAKVGFDLLDRKRNILIRETVSYIEKAKQLENELNAVYNDAYSALKIANMELGYINDIANSAPIDTGLQVSYRSIMGVDIPIVDYTPEKLYNFYGYYDTTDDIDIALEKFQTVKRITIELSEIENSIFRLSAGIKTARKRANALENIIIPRLSEQVKSISSALDEKEREEFSRLKVIKHNLENK